MILYMLNLSSQIYPLKEIKKGTTYQSNNSKWCEIKATITTTTTKKGFSGEINYFW